MLSAAAKRLRHRGQHCLSLRGLLGDPADILRSQISTSQVAVLVGPALVVPLLVVLVLSSLAWSVSDVKLSHKQMSHPVGPFALDHAVLLDVIQCIEILN